MKQNKKRIAITGGIGSGKSSVARMIAEQGYPVFSCDDISREIYRDEEVSKQISKAFPSCLTDGKPDREKLSAVVYSDRQRLKQLENITHPAIMRILQERMNQANGGLVFAEVPLLFEGGYTDIFDEVLVILRDKNMRVESIVKRDGISYARIDQIIKNQFDYENKSVFEHTVIYNDGSLEDLRKRVGSVLEKIRGE